MEPRPRVIDITSYNEFGPVAVACPERDLWAAVIQRAVLDLQGTAKSDRHHRRSARVFLFSDKPEQSPLRFWAEMMFSDPDAFIERLRRDVEAGVLKPKRVACAAS